MKEKPILFSTSMVQAILEERKLMTRRVVKMRDGSLMDDNDLSNHLDNSFSHVMDFTKKYPYWEELKCPYGEVGDILWVRETFGFGTRPCPVNGWRDGIEYKADEKYIDDVEDLPLYDLPEGIEFKESKGWKPSIFMPKDACRIFLEITDIRVERLQDISEEDAIAEGVEKWSDGFDYKCYSKHAGRYTHAKDSFFSLWESINGKESWDKNPFVWVLNFKRIKK